MVITEIRQNDKEKDKAIIFTEEISFSVNKEICISERLFKGKEISQQEIDNIIFESEKKSAFLKGLNYVSRKKCSEKILKDYLQTKTFSEKAIENAIEKLKEYRYIDDEDFANSFVSFNYSNKGKKKIVYELQNKGISQEIIEKLKFSNEKEFENCLNIALKFVKNKDIADLKIKQKLYNHLLYKGYEYFTVQNVLNKISQHNISEDER